MGKMRMGILSPFKGKIGTVVGAKWRGGVWYQRAYSDDVKNPRSDNQQIVRARFSALAELAHGFLTAHTLGFAADALARPTMTTGNVFFRRNWSHVTASGRESVNVDFTGLVCAAGPAVNVHFNAPQFDTPLQVDVDFDDNMAKTAKTGKKTRRSRRSSKAAAPEAAAEAPATEEKAEE